MNEDYIKGMKILLQYSHERHFNIRKYTWIPLFSKYLSNEGLCEKFWTNVQKQDGIYKITKLRYYYAYNYTMSLGSLIDSLLLWARTNEGEDFWYMIYTKHKKQPTLIIGTAV